MTASESTPTREVAMDPPLFTGARGQDDLQFTYLHQVHDLSHDCIKIVGADGTLLSMNRNGQKAMQVDDFATCQGADWLGFWQGEAREAMLAAFERARGGQAAHFAGFCPTMKGEPRWWDVTLAPLHDPTQTDLMSPSPLIVISRDVTTEHLARQHLNEFNMRLQQEVQQQTESLRRERQTLLQTNEELENIAYSMSHDLLTPVRHMLSFARLARNADPDKRERYLGIIERSAEHLSTMIEGVLRFSRAGRQTFQRQPVNLQALLKEVQTELQAAAPGVHWEVGPLPVVSGDAAQLRQALRSLCHNAVKFTRDRPDARVSVQAERHGDEWHLTVEDNGVGFDPNYAHKLFRLFQRLHHQTEYPGAGAELATVRRIADRHGGQVAARGQLGVGAGFTIILPCDTQTS